MCVESKFLKHILCMIKETKYEKDESYLPSGNVSGGIWRRFGGAAYWMVCNSLRTSREPIGEVHAITMTCGARAPSR